MYICWYAAACPAFCQRVTYFFVLQRVPMAKSLLLWATMRSFPVFFSYKNARELMNCPIDSCAGVPFKMLLLSIQQMARRRSGLRATYRKILTWR